MAFSVVGSSWFLMFSACWMLSFCFSIFASLTRLFCSKRVCTWCCSDRPVAESTSGDTIVADVVYRLLAMSGRMSIPRPPSLVGSANSFLSMSLMPCLPVSVLHAMD